MSKSAAYVQSAEVYSRSRSEIRVYDVQTSSSPPLLKAKIELVRLFHRHLPSFETLRNAAVDCDNLFHLADKKQSTL